MQVELVKKKLGIEKAGLGVKNRNSTDAAAVYSALLSAAAANESLGFIDEHIDTIHELIVDRLTSQSKLPKVKRHRLSLLLMRLGYVDESMFLYLQFKSDELKQQIRNISLYGDVSKFIIDLSKVFFDQIMATAFEYSQLLKQIKKNPSIHSLKKTKSKRRSNNIDQNDVEAGDRDEYKQMTGARGSEKADNDGKEDILSEDELFSEESSSSSEDDYLRYNIGLDGGMTMKQLGEDDNSIHMSRLMVWICKELLVFEKLFEQQVFKIEHNAVETIGECLKIVFSKCNRLEQSGINLSFILTMQFKPSVVCYLCFFFFFFVCAAKPLLIILALTKSHVLKNNM